MVEKIKSWWNSGSRRRYGGVDEDKHWGPFTYHNGGENFGVIIESTGDDYASGGTHLTLYLGRHTIILELGDLLKPYKVWVDTSRYDWGSPGDGYWDVYPNRYGAYYCNGEGARGLFYYYGAKTHDSTTDKSGLWFIPWLEQRFYKYEIFDNDGTPVWVEVDRVVTVNKFGVKYPWDVRKHLDRPKFYFLDYDGEFLYAETNLQQRTWLRGTGFFKWLSWFYKPLVSRTIDIQYSGETGDRKGSWKGGTVGRSTDTIPGYPNNQYMAFAKRAKKDDMTLVPEWWNDTDETITDCPECGGKRTYLMTSTQSGIDFKGQDVDLQLFECMKCNFNHSD